MHYLRHTYTKKIMLFILAFMQKGVPEPRILKFKFNWESRI